MGQMALSGSMKPISQTVRGVVTGAVRRGPSYLAYLAHGVAWPRASYQLSWGPRAPAIAQGVFAAVSEWSSETVSRETLESARLLAPAGGQPAGGVGIKEVETLMDAAHRLGITGLDRGFKTLIRAADGSLRFEDLSGARRYPAGTVRFLASRDRDRIAFNSRFGTDLMTEQKARQAIAAHQAAVSKVHRHYAPIDFGGGLTLGQIASTDSGTGRWDFFNADVVAPLVHRKRVLDLGSNNGSLPLMMARAGAAKVLGIEGTAAVADFARLNARILAWRDIRDYDLQIRTGDMRLFLSENLGSFDVVTAFCSLYHLPEADMAAVIRKAASMGAVLILQANDAIDDLPAKRGDLSRLMRENGYPSVTIYSPPGFMRPLLVGTSTPLHLGGGEAGR
jgi:2-polyprenyl-3-methyl-5-hydroxy-6-metoxy-1,4-benzoquinol methylase